MRRIGEKVRLYCMCSQSSITLSTSRLFILCPFYDCPLHHCPLRVHPLQVIEEMETYDSHANQSFGHTWYHEESRYEKVYFPAPSYGIDSNTTFTVSDLTVSPMSKTEYFFLFFSVHCDCVFCETVLFFDVCLWMLFSYFPVVVFLTPPHSVEANLIKARDSLCIGICTFREYFIY